MFFSKIQSNINESIENLIYLKKNTKISIIWLIMINNVIFIIFDLNWDFLLNNLRRIDQTYIPVRSVAYDTFEDRLPVVGALRNSCLSQEPTFVKK